jgi:hypothetical protein
MRWEKTIVVAGETTPNARDSFDGLKTFPDGTRVAIEVEWPWEAVKSDLLKFWRGTTRGQIDLAIEVLHGPEAFMYVVNHVYELHKELFKGLPLVFLALDAPDLNEQPFPRTDGPNYFRESQAA